jgi:CheY-like chemotaxis protein
MLQDERPRILVVDDNADTADVTAFLLRMWGYDAEACYGGAAALEAARAYRPHAVLLDIGMPGMDGFEVARGLRARPESTDIVVIGISGHATEGHRARSGGAGFDHYLFKPVEPEDLRGLLAQVAGQPDTSHPPQHHDVGAAHCAAWMECRWAGTPAPREQPAWDTGSFVQTVA